MLSISVRLRAEFTGKFGGLEWIRGTVYTLPDVDVKTMAMRVLLGMAAVCPTRMNIDLRSNSLLCLPYVGTFWDG